MYKKTVKKSNVVSKNSKGKNRTKKSCKKNIKNDKHINNMTKKFNKYKLINNYNIKINHDIITSKYGFLKVGKDNYYDEFEPLIKNIYSNFKINKNIITDFKKNRLYGFEKPKITLFNNKKLSTNYNILPIKSYATSFSLKKSKRSNAIISEEGRYEILYFHKIPELQESLKITYYIKCKIGGFFRPSYVELKTIEVKEGDAVLIPPDFYYNINDIRSIDKKTNIDVVIINFKE